MPTRDERREEAAQHIALMKGAFSTETDAAIASAVIYEDGEARELEIPEPRFEATKTSVTTDFATAVVQRSSGKTVVVDPTSFTRPGGNYEDGGFGPEQILCSESNLYLILRGLKKSYHDENRGYQCGQLFTDRALYLQDVAFNRDGKIAHADVLAIAEPNRQRALENHRSERECDQCLANRIESIMRAAAAHECETLVCNAFGCGRDAGDESRTIELFKTWIEAHPGSIANVVFAVPRAHFPAFNDAFGAPRPARNERPARRSDDDDNDGDNYYDFDLPAGVTLR